MSRATLGFVLLEHAPTQPLPTPMVYERMEPPRWEYRTLRRDLREEEPPDEAQLNALGAEGWLLVAVAALPGPHHATYYFVRAQ